MTFIMKPYTTFTTPLGNITSIRDFESEDFFKDEQNYLLYGEPIGKCKKCCFYNISCHVEDFKPIITKTKFLGIDNKTTQHYFLCSTTNYSVYYNFKPKNKNKFEDYIKKCLLGI